jgi:hypothetical protein
MTAIEESRAASGKAEVLPGVVLTLVGSGEAVQLRGRADTLRAMATGDVPTEGGVTYVFSQGQAGTVLEEAADVLRAAVQDGWSCTAVLAAGRIGHLHAADGATRFVGATLERAVRMQAALAPRSGVLLCDEEAARMCGVQASSAPIQGPPLSIAGVGDETDLCLEVLWDRLRPGDLAPLAEPSGNAEPVGRAERGSKAGEPRVRATQAGTGQARATQSGVAQPGGAQSGGGQPRARQPRSQDAAPPAADAPRMDTPLSRWVRGTILRTGRAFGFIEDADGLVYYFQPRNVAIDVPLRRGARVIFRILPAMRGAAELRAEDVFVLDAVTSGVLERVNPKGWGLVRLDCHNGLEHRLFVQNASAPGWRAGQTVSCRIGANRQGPVGLPVIDSAPRPTKIEVAPEDKPAD